MAYDYGGGGAYGMACSSSSATDDELDYHFGLTLEEWARDKPLSILQLDPADRAVLRIAGKIVIYNHSEPRSRCRISHLAWFRDKPELRIAFFFSHTQSDRA